LSTDVVIVVEAI